MKAKTNHGFFSEHFPFGPLLRLQAAITSGQPGVVERQNVVDAAKKEWSDIFGFGFSRVSQVNYRKDIGKKQVQQKTRPEESLQMFGSNLGNISEIPSKWM